MQNIMQMLQMFKNAQNPQAMLEQMLQQNPQMATAFNQLRNSTQGSNPRDVAMQLARQKGISEEQVMQMFNSINHR